MVTTDEGSRRLRVLRAEVEADLGALATHHEVTTRALGVADWSADTPVVSVVAVALHHYYGAAESIFERIARFFEGLPERGDRWHIDLLQAMALRIDDIRPAVLRAETLHGLRELLAFRHFFRHAYAVSFDPVKLRRAAEDLVRTHPLLAADLDRFQAVVAAAAAAGAAAPEGGG